MAKSYWDVGGSLLRRRLRVLARAVGRMRLTDGAVTLASRQRGPARAGIESLETRRLLTVFTSYDPSANALSVTTSIDTRDTVIVGVVNIGGTNYLAVNGVPVTDPGGANVPVSSVEAMSVDTNSKDDVIDCSGVNRANGFRQRLNSNVLLTAGTGDDNVTATEFDDEIKGNKGQDTISAGAGNDRIEGHAGNDTLIGGAGDDTYEYDPGADGFDSLVENAGQGRDAIDFSDWDAAVSFSLASNLSQPVTGVTSTVSIALSNISTFENIYAPNLGTADTLTGNDQDNLLAGRGGNDTLVGNDGNDTLEGGGGADSLDGGIGDDVLNGGPGLDTIHAGDGNDRLGGDGFSDLTNMNGLASPPDFSQILDEASGLAFSRRYNNVIYTIEDHGNGNLLYANDVSTGQGLGYYSLTGATNNDWEDLAYFKDGTTDYLYVADTGDNDLVRTDVTIYRVPEPSTIPAGTGDNGPLAGVQQIKLTYPGGTARDAEALMVDPLTGDLYIPSKQDPGSTSAHLYRVAAPTAAQWAAGTTTLALADQGTMAFNANTANDSPSAGDISPSGLEVAVKSDNQIYWYARNSTATSLSTLLTGRPAQVVNARDKDNRESVAFDPTGASLYTVSEGNGLAIQRYDRGDGDDQLYGEIGNDSLYGGVGNDSMYGGANDDTYFFAGSGLGSDYLEEADNVDTDTLDFTNFAQAAALDLTVTAAQTVAAGQLTVRLSSATGFENVVGSAFGDTLTGNDRTNTIDGLAGNDLIYGGFGNDTLYGRDGNDTVYGDKLAVIFVPGDGNDLIYGGTGDDILQGDSYGSPNSTPGNDTIYGEDGNDQLYGDAFANSGLIGDEIDGDDHLYGGIGNDILQGSGGNDVTQGDAGNDTYLYGGTLPLGSDTVTEAANVDTDKLDFSAFGHAAIVNLKTTTAQTVSATFLTLTLSSVAGLENVAGSMFADNVTGNSRDNRFDLGDGNDTAYGSLGNDLIYGGNGNDTLQGDDSSETGQPGNDTLYGEAGLDHLYGDPGSGLSYGAGNDYLDGGTEDDVLYGDGSGSGYYGRGEGDDTLLGGDGNDQMYGDTGYGWSWAVGYGSRMAGNDYLDGGAGDDHMWGDGASAYGYGWLFNYDGDDALLGGDGNDILYGDRGAGSGYGGYGDDQLTGGLGNDSAYGEDGNDTYFFPAAAGANLGTDVVNEGTNGFSDTLDFTGFPTGAAVNIGLIGNQIVAAGVLVLNLSSATGIENVVGSDFGDTITGNASANAITGAGGGDSMSGGGGSDTYRFAGAGNLGSDTITEADNLDADALDFSQFTGAGISVDLAAIGAQPVSVGRLILTLIGQAGIENVTGTALGDTIAGNTRNNVLNGGAGNDTVDGASGSDTVRGGDGADDLNGGTGADSVFGDAGDDSIAAFDNFVDTISGGLGSDTVTSHDSGTINDIINADVEHVS